MNKQKVNTNLSVLCRLPAIFFIQKWQIILAEESGSYIQGNFYPRTEMILVIEHHKCSKLGPACADY